MWLYFAIIGFALLAVVAILDKFIVSNEQVQPLVYAFYSSVIALPALIFIPFGVERVQTPFGWLIVALTGIACVLSFYGMFRAFSLSKVSHIGPLLGAAVPFCIFILSRFFLAEVLGGRQLIAMTILIIGSLTISLENSPKGFGWQRGIPWAVFAAINFAIFYVGAKYIDGLVGFYSGFIWAYGAAGLASLALLFFPSVRESLRKKGPKTALTKGKMIVFAADKIISLVATVLIQYAVAAGSVTIVNSLTGMKYAILVVLVALLSRFYPEKFKEDYIPGELVQEFFAVALIAIGVGLLLT